MLGKLIKHELKATYWEFAILFIAILGVTVMEKIFLEVNIDSPIVEIFRVLFTVLYVVCLIAGFAGSVVLIVKRFYTNLVKDQGYLSFTLPVTVSQHIFSKVLVAFIWSLATYVVLALSFVIMMIGNGLSHAPEAIRELIEITTRNNAWGYVLEFIFLFLIGIFVTALQYYACIAFGQMMGKHKVLGAVAAYFANGMILNVISTVIITIIDIVYKGEYLETISGNENVIGQQVDIMGDIEFFDIYGGAMLHILLIFMIVMACVYFFITKVILEKKLNLE